MFGVYGVFFFFFVVWERISVAAALAARGAAAARRAALREAVRAGYGALAGLRLRDAALEADPVGAERERARCATARAAALGVRVAEIAAAADAQRVRAGLGLGQAHRARTRGARDGRWRGRAATATAVAHRAPVGRGGARGRGLGNGPDLLVRVGEAQAAAVRAGAAREVGLAVRRVAVHRGRDGALDALVRLVAAALRRAVRVALEAHGLVAHARGLGGRGREGHDELGRRRLVFGVRGHVGERLRDEGVRLAETGGERLALEVVPPVVAAAHPRAVIGCDVGVALGEREEAAAGDLQVLAQPAAVGLRVEGLVAAVLARVEGAVEARAGPGRRHRRVGGQRALLRRVREGLEAVRGGHGSVG